MSQTKLPYVPPEGQPPSWWQDLRVQAVIVAVATPVVARIVKSEDQQAVNSKVTEIVSTVFALVVPAVLTLIGQMKSIARRKIQSGTIQAAVELPANVPPALTAAAARAKAPDDPQPNPLNDVNKAYGTDKLTDKPKGA